MTVPQSLEAVTPEWLSDTLARGVRSLRRAANAAFNSATAHLDVEFADGDRTALVVKLNENGLGEAEVRLYELSGQRERDMLDPITVRCRAAGHDTPSGCSFVLLDDISATHRVPVERANVLALRGVPSDDRWLDQIAETLGRFHAVGWGRTELLSRFEAHTWFGSDDAFARTIDRQCDQHARFVADVPPFVPREIIDRVTRLVGGLQVFWERHLRARLASPDRRTLAHGDCYLGQFMCPRDPLTATTRLIDFQTVHAGFAAGDLAFLMPTFWTREQRRETDREQRMLRTYHAALVASGVGGVALDDVWLDYRLMVALTMLDPLWDFCNGSSEGYWWPKLQCLSAAFDDLHCDEFCSA